jgi:hypothetical protein
VNRLILLLGLTGLASSAGHLTMYRGHGPVGPYSGVAVRSGPLFVYQGRVSGHRQTGIRVESDPLSMYWGDGLFSGMRVASGPLTTFRGHAGRQRFRAMGLNTGNSTYYSGRVGLRSAISPAQTIRGTRQHVGNTTVYGGTEEGSHSGTAVSKGHGYAGRSASRRLIQRSG